MTPSDNSPQRTSWYSSAATSLVVTAAFIGPGTIATASMAGANFGYALLWALAFAVLATIVLQEMAARVGIVAKQGLAELLRQHISHPALKMVTLAMVACAIGIGNAAYEGGNLLGAALGLQSLLGGPIQMWPLLLAAVAAILLYSGNYRLIQSALALLVALMSIIFLLTLMMAEPHWPSVFQGFLQPSLPQGSALVVMGLIGTTLVPYNVFLQASLASQSQHPDTPQALKQMRYSTVGAILCGGFITFALVVISAATFFTSQTTLTSESIAWQLQPLLGDFAPYVFSAGLFAAGLSSAIAAPLAASMALCGAFGWSQSPQGKAFRSIWATVLLGGVIVASTGIKPLLAIVIAQVSNALLLPFIAFLLLWICNQSTVLKEYKNRLGSNVLAVLVIAITLALATVKLT